MKNLFLVLAAAALMSLGWLGVSGLPMLVGLVPLLFVADRLDGSVRSFWRMAGWIVLFITLWYAATVWWVWYATPAGPIAATFFAWIFTGIPFLLWFWISRRAPKALSYAVLVSVWILGEWLYQNNQASFPWLNLGNGFAHEPWAVQWYEATGVYGGTLWVLVSNIVVCEIALLRRRWLTPALVVVVPLALSLGLYWTFQEPARTAKVTIVQPNVDPYSDIDPSDRLANLVELASEAPRDVRFIVMPEGALDDFVMVGRADASPSLQTLQELVAERFPDATLVLGATAYRPYGTTKATETARGNAETGYYDVYNSALALDASGHVQFHHKAKLVIGTEMMPTWWWMRYLRWVVRDLDSYVGQLGYGSARTVFKSPDDIYSGAAICWESVFGEYFTEFVRGGAEMMMVITNDGWWRDTPGYRQHFDYSRLRAIETRRSIARSANTGRSGFISPRGDLGATLGWDERGTITADVSLSRGQTFYVRFGDWVCRVSLLVFGLSILSFIAYRVRRRDLH